MSNLPCTGFNLMEQRLLCLIVLNDRLGHILSDKAKDAFFRAFIVQERDTSEVLCNYRFRYQDGDSWYTVNLSAEKQALPVKKRIEFIRHAIEDVMLRKSLQILADSMPPKDAVTCFYPPDPENGEATLQWLIDQDLVEITKVEVTGKDGINVPVQKAD